MQSGKVSVGVALVAVAAAVALFVVLRDDDEPEPVPAPVTEQPAPGPADEPAEPAEPAEPEVPEIVVRDGRPVGGVAELEFRRGDRVRFDVSSDADDEVHVHGYDIYQDIEAGATTRVAFGAELDGVFEVELHDAHADIARLTIRP